MTHSEDTLVDLSRDECERLLGDQRLGRLAIVAGDQPLVFPIAFVWHDQSILFRSIPGSKVAAFDRPVAFEIDGFDVRYHGGWSVLAIGHAKPVTDAATLAALEALPLPHWIPIDGAVWVRLDPSEITGRRLLTARDR